MDILRKLALALEGRGKMPELPYWRAIYIRAALFERTGQWFGVDHITAVLKDLGYPGLDETEGDEPSLKAPQAA